METMLMEAGAMTTHVSKTSDRGSHPESGQAPGPALVLLTVMVTPSVTGPVPAHFQEIGRPSLTPDL